MPQGKLQPLASQGQALRWNGEVAGCFLPLSLRVLEGGGGTSTVGFDRLKPSGLLLGLLDK